VLGAPVDGIERGGEEEAEDGRVSASGPAKQKPKFVMVTS
jgi:hypothetical protein